MGLTPRITRVGPDLMPYEALSFPAFDYFALLEEDWEDSDLLTRVEYMLLIRSRVRRKGPLRRPAGSDGPSSGDRRPTTSS